MFVIFYKADGEIFDKLIRWWTGSAYSHVEAVAPGWPGDISQPCTIISSSPRDGGVRDRAIALTPGHWDVLEVTRSTGADQASFDFMLAERGRKYDWKGIMLSQILSLGIHDRNRWFCSELVASALLLENPHRLSPGKLFAALSGQYPARPGV